MDEFAKAFDDFKDCAFRLETLDNYISEGEQPLVQAFLRGEPLPPENEEREWWYGFLKDAAEAGRRIERLHALPEVLTPYLKYEIHWGYCYLGPAGEDIRLMMPDAPADLRALATSDYWLFDDRLAFVMNYDSDGKYLGYEKVDDADEVAELVSKRARLWEAAIPLREYLARVRA